MPEAMDDRQSSLNSGEKESADTLPIDNQPSLPPTNSNGIASSTPPRTSEIPNGGLIAWLQVFAGFWAFFNSWGLVNTFGVFQDFYSTTLIPDSSNSDISWIGSMQAFLLCAASVFAGPIFDHGHPRVLLIFGSIMSVFGMMMTSLGTKYWHMMLAQGLCLGFGSGCLFLPAVAIVPSYFTTKRALATGIAATGSSLGGIIYPIVFHQLQPRIGFGWTTRVIGFIMIATLVIPCAFIKARSSSHGTPSKSKLFDFAAFKEPSFSMFCIASFVGFIGLYIPFFYISAYATKVGVDSSLSFYMLPIMSAGSSLGRLLPGTIAHRAGPVNVIGVCTFIAGVIAFCWIAVGRSVAGLIVWAILYGAFSGSYVSLQTPSIASISGHLRTFGGRTGLNTFCSALGILIGTPIAGLLVGEGSWVGMQVLAGCTLFASAALITVTRLLSNKTLRQK